LIKYTSQGKEERMPEAIEGLKEIAEADGAGPPPA
jgi:hypothetical protein